MGRLRVAVGCGRRPAGCSTDPTTDRERGRLQRCAEIAQTSVSSWVEQLDRDGDGCLQARAEGPAQLTSSRLAQGPGEFQPDRFLGLLGPPRPPGTPDGVRPGRCLWAGPLWFRQDGPQSMTAGRPPAASFPPGNRRGVSARSTTDGGRPHQPGRGGAGPDELFRKQKR